MKKLITFLLAILLCIGEIYIYNISLDNSLKHPDKDFSKKSKALNYEACGLEKMECPSTIGACLDKETILLLGSSEIPNVLTSNKTRRRLIPQNVYAHPETLTNQGNSNFNMMLVGVAHVQSLEHAINIGGLEPYIKNNKVVLNLSPQWFKQGGVDPEAFASVFSIQMMDKFMKNKNISKELKLKVVRRSEELLRTYPKAQKQVSKYEDELLGKNNNIINKISRDWVMKFNGLKAKRTLNSLEYKTFPKDSGTLDFDTLNFEQMKKDAEEEGKAVCTNNPFYFYNGYYDTFIKPNINKLKNSAAQKGYSDPSEYGDLQLFLDVCKELDLDVLLVNIPVNGYWYDYVEFPKSERQKYYQRVSDLAKKYNVSMLDLRNEEYNPYFFRDAYHLGWKGWVYLDEGIYKFYKKDRV